jgi:nucleolar complex protein 2
LDFEYIIRAPSSYPKTRVYQESLAEELVYLLAEYHSALSTNIAFPEIVLPVIVTLKRHLKRGSCGGVKVQGMVKGLVEKLEAGKVWVEKKRSGVGFAPRDRGEVERFSQGKGMEVAATPLGAWVKVLRKVREGKRREIERALREEKGTDEEKEEDEQEDEEDDEDEDEE